MPAAGAALAADPCWSCLGAACSRVVLDPGVRVGYAFQHKYVLHSPQFNYTAVTGHNLTTWREVGGLARQLEGRWRGA